MIFFIPSMGYRFRLVLGLGQVWKIIKNVGTGMG